ncbi:MAG TPA: DegT/DnrJ/EryC1/StrS family aminotransferase [Aeromonadales bacterium]|nr:DegT/DnrJ/EryC1/StrS family aminotransferase [Aeromonadales bacterium]
MIHVTKTYLPDIKKYKHYVDKIYQNGRVTNNGPLLVELEEKLADYLGVKHIVLVSNGTAALEIAYRTLDLNGFAITSPFSFVATTSSLVTNSILPIFADINPQTFNIEADNIEALCTPHTRAIVPVHVFGNACEVEKIAQIAQRLNLKVVYDAAHAFNVRFKGNSILNYGDISTLSFHATKLFHTIEGGALVINDDDLVQKARYLINFGIENAESIPELGINAKMNEFEAAMGLCMLEEMHLIEEKRAEIYSYYQQELNGFVQFQQLNSDASNNYSYFPVVFENEKQLLAVQADLNAHNIFPRRYFYPSLNTLSYIEPRQKCPISEGISDKVLCLPIFSELENNFQKIIINTIKAKVGLQSG